MVVVAMLLLFGAMGCGLVALAADPFGALHGLFMGMAILLGALWNICLLLAIFFCATNPRPPRPSVEQDAGAPA